MMSRLAKRYHAVKVAWGIETAPGGRLIGVGWFNWNLDRPGFSTMTFATRREARVATKLVRVPYGFPKARPCRVRVVVTAQ